MRKGTDKLNLLILKEARRKLHLFEVIRELLNCRNSYSRGFIVRIAENAF